MLGNETIFPVVGRLGGNRPPSSTGPWISTSCVVIPCCWKRPTYTKGGWVDENIYRELWNTWRYLQRTLESWCINWLWGFRYISCFLGPSLPWIWSKWSTDRCKAKTRGFSDRQIAQLVSAPVPCQWNLLKRLGTSWDDGHCISANSNFIQLRCCRIPYFQSFPEFPVFNSMKWVTRASQVWSLFGEVYFLHPKHRWEQISPSPKLVHFPKYDDTVNTWYA